MRENKVYLNYVSEVFGYFKDLKEGEGCFFFRVLNAKNRNDIGKVRMLGKVMTNLVCQGYFYSDRGGDFIKLTEKGYAYTQDGQLEEISINLAEIINFLDQKKPTFQTLWSFIGKEGEAPFYVTGPEYFNVARNFVRLETVSYSEYMKLLQEKGQSTSRSIWYNTLFKGIKREEMDAFLDTLSTLIRNVYNVAQSATTTATAVEDDLEFLAEQSLETTLQPAQPTTPTKTVFISYSHDTPQHEKWVHQFADDIRAKGIRVITDENIRFGQDTNHFMEESVAISNRVLIVVTEVYKNKSDGRMAGVGYETGVITGELVNDQNTIKFIPIIREGSGKEFYPLYLSNRWGADFTDDTHYDDMLEKLTADILKS